MSTSQQAGGFHVVEETKAGASGGLKLQGSSAESMKMKTSTTTASERIIDDDDAKDNDDAGGEGSKSATTCCKSIKNFSVHALDAGDYAYDNVRSRTLHIFMFLAIFFSVFDIYIHLVMRGVPSWVLLFIYFGVVIMVTILVYPLFFGNHTTMHSAWLALTGLVAGLATGGRISNLVMSWNDREIRMNTWSTINSVFLVFTFVATCVLMLRMLLRPFQPYQQRRNRQVREVVAEMFPLGLYADPKGIARVRNKLLQRDLFNLLWPSAKSSVVLNELLKQGSFRTDAVKNSEEVKPKPKARMTRIAYPSKLFIASLLSLGISAYVSTWLFYSADYFLNSEFLADMKTLEAKAQAGCGFVANLTLNGTSGFGQTALTTMKDACISLVGVGNLTGLSENVTVNFLGTTVDTFEQVAFAVSIGMKVGASVALVYAIYASIVTFRVFPEIFFLYHHSIDAVGGAGMQDSTGTTNYQFSEYFRFVALFVSNVLWGMLFTTLIFGLICFFFGLPIVQEFFLTFWPVILSFVLYLVLDSLIMTRFVFPRYVVNDDKVVDRHWFRFFMLGMDLFYVPYALTAGLTKTLMLLGYGILGLMRPDLNILPKELEIFDRSHLSYIAMIRFHHAQVYGLKTRQQWETAKETNNQNGPDSFVAGSGFDFHMVGRGPIDAKSDVSKQ